MTVYIGTTTLPGSLWKVCLYFVWALYDCLHRNYDLARFTLEGMSVFCLSTIWLSTWELRPCQVYSGRYVCILSEHYMTVYIGTTTLPGLLWKVCLYLVWALQYMTVFIGTTTFPGSLWKVCLYFVWTLNDCLHRNYDPERFTLDGKSVQYYDWTI